MKLGGGWGQGGGQSSTGVLLFCYKKPLAGDPCEQHSSYRTQHLKLMGILQSGMKKEGTPPLASEGLGGKVSSIKATGCST
jgi:hypothetical protein